MLTFDNVKATIRTVQVWPEGSRWILSIGLTLANGESQYHDISFEHESVAKSHLRTMQGKIGMEVVFQASIVQPL